MTTAGTKRIEKAAPVINKSSVLDIREVMKAGEILSVCIQPDFRLDQITKADENEMQVYVWEKGLMYLFSIGKDGSFQVTGEVVKDEDGFYQKLKSDPADMALRNYVKNESLADSRNYKRQEDTFPEIMTHNQAAKFLGIKSGTLYNNREVPRLKGNRYSKDSLLKYLNNKDRR